MIDYNKYELMKECLQETFDVYKETLDVSDYVPKNHLEKTFNWIFKNMKKKQRKIDKEDRKYQRRLKRLIKCGKIIDTTSEESVLDDFKLLEESENETEEKKVVADGQSSTVTSIENVKPEETATPGEDTMPTENVALGENVTPGENVNGGDCNVK